LTKERFKPFLEGFILDFIIITSHSLGSIGAAQKNKAIQKEIAQFYKVTIPAGESLTKVKGETNKFRGMYHGKKGVAGNAILEKGQLSKSALKNPNALQLANLMNIGAVVVGEYHMVEIQEKLSELTDSITDLKQMIEGEIVADLKTVKTEMSLIRSNLNRMVEDKDFCRSKLDDIAHLRRTVEKIFHRSNSALFHELRETNKLDFKHYKERVKNIKKWLSVHVASLYLMSELLELAVLFEDIGRETATENLEIFNQESTNIRRKISERQKEWRIKFGIDLKNGYRDTEVKLKQLGAGLVEVGTGINIISKKIAKQSLIPGVKKAKQQLKKEKISQSLVEDIRIQLQDYQKPILQSQLKGIPEIDIVIQDERYYYKIKKNN
jgi:hypothetical protein